MRENLRLVLLNLTSHICMIDLATSLHVFFTCRENIIAYLESEGDRCLTCHRSNQLSLNPSWSILIPIGSIEDSQVCLHLFSRIYPGIGTVRLEQTADPEKTAPVAQFGQDLCCLPFNLNILAALL